MASVGDVDTIGEGTLERNAAGSRHSLCNDATRAVPYMYDVHAEWRFYDRLVSRRNNRTDGPLFPRI